MSEKNQMMIKPESEQTSYPEPETNEKSEVQYKNDLKIENNQLFSSTMKNQSHHNQHQQSY